MFYLFRLTFSHYNSFVPKMYTHQETVIHNVFLLEKIAVLVDLSASTNLTSALSWEVTRSEERRVGKECLL